MNLKDLNLNKVIGREAVMQSTWSVATKDGRSYAVWVGMKSGLVGSRLIVKVNDAPFVDKRILAFFGELAQFDLGGDAFAVRHSGLGLFGKFVLVQNGRELSQPTVAPGREAGTARAEGPSGDETWETWIEEAERFSEPLGDEVRVIDNTRSSSATERKITVSRQWTQSVALDVEKATEFSGSLDAKLPISLGFSASATRSIKRRYAISEEVTRTYSEEVTISVLPKTLTKVTFSWRQVWQRGIVVGRSAQGLDLRVPFEVKLHPTFDQTQEDVKGENQPDDTSASDRADI